MSEQTRNSKKVVTIETFRNAVRLRWSHMKKRYSVTLGLRNEKNLLQATLIAAIITEDTHNGLFDFTLNKYYPQKARKSTWPRQVEVSSDFLTLYDLWIRTTNLIPTPYNVLTTRRMVIRWGRKISVEDVPDVFLNEKIAAVTFNVRLNILRRLFKWLLKKKFIPANYLEDIQNKANRAPKRSQRKPFTDDEIARIFRAYETDEYCTSRKFKHSHYCSFVKFIFLTGVRNGEAIGLQVKKVDFKKGYVTIDQSYSRQPMKSSNIKNRVLKNTKTGSSRNLPLTSDLDVMLKPLCEGRTSDDFVFTTVNGTPIDDQMFQKRIHKPLLKMLDIEDRDLYACRHTLGTISIEQGLTPLEAGYLMGHSNPKTVMERYAHLRTVPKRMPSFDFDAKKSVNNPDGIKD